MKKGNSAVRLDKQPAPRIEAIPVSPPSPDTGPTGLEYETSEALRFFEQNKHELANLEAKMQEQLPEAGKEGADLANYEYLKADTIAWANLILRQLPHLKELEYIVTEPRDLKRIKSALNFLEGLKVKYGAMGAPKDVQERKIAGQKDMGVQLRNREQIELKELDDKARKATARMRRDLANLKRSFYKMYGMTYSEALVLPSTPKQAKEEAPKGFWKGLAEKIWEKPKSEEEKKFEAAKSKDAKSMIKRIKQLDGEIKQTWDEVVGSEAPFMEPVTTISPDTLRAVLAQELPDKSDEDIARMSETILMGLRKDVPEEVRETSKTVDWSNVYELKPERAITPEPKVVIKTEAPKPSRKEVPTLKIVREEKPEVKEEEKKDRKQTAIEIMQIFGGGEQARLRGSNLFEAVKNQMSLMKIEDMDPLDYVSLVAQRTKAENENNKKAADEYDRQIQALNKKLDFGTTDPSKGINMGASRLMESRALGSTPARAEAARMAEQIAAVPVQKVERPTLRKPKVPREEVEPVTLRLVKPKKEEVVEAKPQEIPAPPEILTRSVELRDRLDKPLDLQLASYYVPNARLAWDLFDKAIADKPQIVPEIQKMMGAVKMPDTGNLATSLVYALGDYLRLEEEYFTKPDVIVDEQTKSYLGRRDKKLRESLMTIEKNLGLNILGDGGFLDVAAWDPDKMAEAEVESKYAKAQETIPNYGSFARAVKEQSGLDDEALLKKYFVTVENYVEEVKRGDAERMNAAENAWRALDDGLGIEHPIMKDLLYSEPEKKSQMQRIAKRTARSAARDRSWRP